VQIFDLPQHEIDAFDSTGVAMRFLPAIGGTSVHVATMEPGGTLGRHRAVRRQLFAVVAGSGEVQVGDEPRREVGPGTLILWETGEVHQTWALTELTAVVVETTAEIDLSRAR
jgi:quercetin dioxygenase-like cupin family protein